MGPVGIGCVQEVLEGREPEGNRGRVDKTIQRFVIFAPAKHEERGDEYLRAFLEWADNPKAIKSGPGFFVELDVRDAEGVERAEHEDRESAGRDPEEKG